MAYILVNDLMDDLRDEKTGLLSDLEKCQKLNELLLKYRICLINYLNVCKCIKPEELSCFQELEKQFTTLKYPKSEFDESRVTSQTDNEVMTSFLLCKEEIETNS